MKTSLFGKIALATAVVGMSTLAHAQTVDIGKREYANNCAACHGLGGQGNGPMAGLLEQALPDLTQLQKNNQGVFPYARIYEVIDGREQVKWHGSRDMPIWGKEYTETAPEQLGFYYGQADAEAFVRGRILALIGHIYTLQAE